MAPSYGVTPFLAYIYWNYNYNYLFLQKIYLFHYFASTFTGFLPIVLYSFTGYTSNRAEKVPLNFTICITYMNIIIILITASNVFRVSYVCLR